MKSLVEISVPILQNCGMVCGANPSRDILTVQRRSKLEGDSFLTITLPAFCSGFEKSLDLGYISPSHFPGFSFRKGRCLPKFLSGFTEMIFDRNGVLLAEPSVECIRSVRQICLCAKKLFLPCSQARERKAQRSFLQVESEMRSHVVPGDLYEIFKKVSKLVWVDIVRSVPFGDAYGQFIPRHGPGTTQEGITGNAKYCITEWPLRLEGEFPFSEFGCANILNLESDAHLPIPVTYLEPRDERPVRVCFVPKTMKAPRVIAVEPVCMQYIQQSIANWLRGLIETSSSYASGHVNFTDQSVNNQLALASSKTGRFATIDLSDASDRVSSRLVWAMLEDVPVLRRQIFSCRTTRAKLPSGEVIPLRKFASMGSALCFPVEAMVFYIAVLSIRLHSAGAPVTPDTVRNVSGGVYVYGDDIIVPVDVAPLVSNTLQAFGLKVNTAKSFWTGKFRESCGVDAYDGEDVTPVYLRRNVTGDKADPHGFVSTVSFGNQLYWAGYWTAAKYIRSLFAIWLPTVDTRSAGVGWNSFQQGNSANGWDEGLQRLRLRCLVPTPVKRSDLLDGDSALLKCFSLIGLDTYEADHLSKSVRYGNLALKRRWILV